MVVDPDDTLPPVAKTKRVSPQVLAAFASVLKAWMVQNHDNNQTRAAKKLGCTQSHISAMLAGSRGPGLNTLILLRDQTHMTLDDMLGLPHLATLTTPLTEVDVRRVSREEYLSLQAAHEKVLAERAAMKGPSAKAKRAKRA